MQLIAKLLMLDDRQQHREIAGRSFTVKDGRYLQKVYVTAVTAGPGGELEHDLVATFDFVPPAAD